MSNLLYKVCSGRSWWRPGRRVRRMCGGGRRDLPSWQVVVRRARAWAIPIQASRSGCRLLPIEALAPEWVARRSGLKPPAEAYFRRTTPRARCGVFRAPSCDLIGASCRVVPFLRIGARMRLRQRPLPTSLISISSDAGGSRCRQPGRRRETHDARYLRSCQDCSAKRHQRTLDYIAAARSWLMAPTGDQ